MPMFDGKKKMKSKKDTMTCLGLCLWLMFYGKCLPCPVRFWRVSPTGMGSAMLNSYEIYGGWKFVLVQTFWSR